MKPISLLLLVLLPTLLAQTSAPARKSTALDAQEDYIRIIKTGKPAEAFNKYWDMDATLRIIFGTRYSSLPLATRAKMRITMDSWFTSNLKKPEFIESMSKATYSTPVVFELSETETILYYEVTAHTKGAEPVPNQNVWRKTDAGWRIVDGGTSGGVITAKLRGQYAPDADKLTPDEFVRAIIQATK